MKILHITPHLGGGAGKVILNLAIHDENENSIITLDYANSAAEELCKKNNITLYSEIGIAQLKSLITEADIVLFHFWNHPLLYDLLLNNSLPAMRCVFWNHTAGLYPPNVIPSGILDYADKFVATSRITEYAESIRMYPEKNKFDFILSVGDISDFLSLEHIDQKNFTVGYVGTVDYSKMHPDFIKMSEAISVPGIRFIILGGNKDKEYAEDAPENFYYLGKVNNVYQYLQTFDVFGYPLNPHHFGTAEQSIQEAMAAGVVPVVMDNACERNLVIDHKTGLIAKNENEYIHDIELLYHDKDLKAYLSRNTREYAKERFSLDYEIKEWNRIFKEVIRIQKKIHKYSDKTFYEPHELFFESIGEYSRPFSEFINNGSNYDELVELLKKPEWISYSKGTPRQYYNFFKDNDLKRIYDCYSN